MQIKLNEKTIEIPPGTGLCALRRQFKPDADLCIHNGFPQAGDPELEADDEIILIRRGEIPAADELETLLAARHTPGVHTRIKQATVGIAGVGGLGSAIAVALARIGIGRLVIADFDLVEPSNLNRQQYFIDQLGQPKVEALRENLRRINPYVEVESHHLRLTPDNTIGLFAACRIMVEAFDAPDQKAMLVECWRSNSPTIPLVAASGMAGHGSANRIATRKLGSNFYLVGDLETAAAPGCGLMAPRVGVAAHHQANAVLQLLLGENPAGESS